MKSAAPIPHLVVNDGVVAIQFYEAAFGAVCDMTSSAFLKEGISFTRSSGRDAGNRCQMGHRS